MNDKLHVAIIGAGPAGLTLALALSKRTEITVTVFEKGKNHLSAATFNPGKN